MVQFIWTRLVFLWAVSRIWGRAIMLIYGVAAGYDFGVAQFAPTTWQLPRIADVFPGWSWQAWAIVGLAILLIVIFEGAFRRASRGTSSDNREVRQTLAVYTQEGQEIVQQCHAASRARDEVPEKDADSWANKVFEYLRDNLGPDYAVRFDNPSGLPVGMTTLSPPYSHVEGYVRNRLAMLNIIMQELATTH